MPPVRARRSSSLGALANPTLVGAITVLIVLVAVMLAYTANNGLPFVPTRELKIELPNGEQLVKGNAVREGGQRIGVVASSHPVRLANGQVAAEEILHLDRSAGAFPIDTVAEIRTQTAIGGQYLDLQRGHAARMIPDGGTVPASQVIAEPEFDQVLSTFDQPTRQASDVNLYEFGNAFAGRGGDLNTTLSTAPRTLSLLRAVADKLADPETRLSNFFTQLDITAGTLAPISPTFAHLFTTLANTFAAIDRDPAALRSTVAETPGTLSTGTASLAVQRPFLADLARLGRELTPAFASLQGALPTVNAALRTGTRVTRRSPVLYGNLQQAVGALKTLALTPTTNAALRGLTATVATLQPQLRFLGPHVTVCNYWNYWWSYLGESQTSPTPEGFALRVLLTLGNPTQPNDLDTEPANVPANGGGLPGTVPVFLHDAVYGSAVDGAGNADCENGQLGYITRFTGAPSKFNIHTDQNPPLGYRRGSTYARVVGGQGQGRGPDHVPDGETFTREPGGIGAQIPDPQANQSLPLPPGG